jgi:hypothetical protein
MTETAIHSVDQLLALPTHEFVPACYRSLLFRAPDPEGLLHYVGVVAKGQAKLDIAAAIASSEEARVLPPHRKHLLAEVLVRHASTLIKNASTPPAREDAAERVQAYLEAASGARVAGQQGPAADETDPFSSYFTAVIQDRH